MHLKPSDFKVGAIVTDTETGELAQILSMEDSRYTAKITYIMRYLKNNRRARRGFYKMYRRFKPNPAATILYGKTNS